MHSLQKTFLHEMHTFPCRLGSIACGPCCQSALPHTLHDTALGRSPAARRSSSVSVSVPPI
jgi:hypothetical protein